MDNRIDIDNQLQMIRDSLPDDVDLHACAILVVYRDGEDSVSVEMSVDALSLGGGEALAEAMSLRSTELQKQVDRGRAETALIDQVEPAES